MKSSLTPYFTSLRDTFALNLRSLAIFRIAIAGLVLTDLWDRAHFMNVFYTDWGVLPRAALLEHFNQPWKISFHLISGEASVMTVIFLIHAVFAGMMLVGYRTRMASIMTWVLCNSLQARNYMVLQGGDVLFRVVLFIAIFLPLAAHYSFDRYLNRVPKPEKEDHSDMATVFYFFQICFVYWFTSILKLSGPSFPVWWTESTAVYYALNVDQFTKPLGFMLLQLPTPVLGAMTRAVIMVEILAPFCLVMPFLNKYFRVLGIILLMGLHAGFGSAMALGPFPWVGIFSMIPFIPGGFWKREFKQLRLKFLVDEAYEADKKEMPPSILARFPVIRWARDGFIAFLIVYIFLWNCREAGFFMKLPMKYGKLGHFFQIDQVWNMFSPPMRDDGWFVVEGVLRNGAKVDLFQDGAPVNYDKPKYGYKRYKSQRWRKYMMSLWLKSQEKHRLYYGKYLCRDWNARNGGAYQLEKFKMYYFQEDTPPPGEPIKASERKMLWEHFCFKTDEDIRKEEEKKKKKAKKKTKAKAKKDQQEGTTTKDQELEMEEDAQQKVDDGAGQKVEEWKDEAIG